MTAAERQQHDLGALSAWAPELAQTFVTLASDIALVVDGDGVITSVAQGPRDPIAPTAHTWVGRAWVDTVTGDTRTKIEQLLDEVSSTGLARRREVSHPSARGPHIPVAYTAIRLGDGGPVLAVGRDLRAIAAIQQRYLDSQRELERGYWKARQSESRYRLLFQVATDAVLVVDPQQLTVVESNGPATQLFDLEPVQLAGRPFNHGFEHRTRAAVDELLHTARRTGRPAELRAQLAGKVVTAAVAATPFRAGGDGLRLLVRVRPIDGDSPTAELHAALARLVDGSPDMVVVTDAQGGIRNVNAPFLALVRQADEAALRGQPLERWLGEPGRDVPTLLRQVREHGLADARMTARVPDGPPSLLGVSAALLTEGDQECIGFTLRALPHAQLGGTLPPLGHDLRQALTQLAEHLGHDDLPMLRRTAAALAERHFVELALVRTGGDAVAAARLLGISPETLRRRRRRHGGTTPDDTAGP